LNDIIWHRECGKPPGLQVGSTIHAERLDYEWHIYGKVVQLNPKSCIVQPPGSRYTDRVLFDRCHVEILTPEKWTWIERNVREHNERITREVDEQLAREAQGPED